LALCESAKHARLYILMMPFWSVEGFKLQGARVADTRKSFEDAVAEVEEVAHRWTTKPSADEASAEKAPVRVEDPGKASSRSRWKTS
jgi:hypothetical protein